MEELLGAVGRESSKENAAVHRQTVGSASRGNRNLLEIGPRVRREPR
jgi:hypothetical protein